MPNYSMLTPDEVTAGVDEAIAEAEIVLESIVIAGAERTFDNTLRPLDRIADILDHANYHYAFMGYVHPDKDVRSAGKKAEEKKDKWASEIFFREGLNAAVKEYAATEEASNLQGEHLRLLEFVLRDLRPSRARPRPRDPSASQGTDSDARSSWVSASNRTSTNGTTGYSSPVTTWKVSPTPTSTVSM